MMKLIQTSSEPRDVSKALNMMNVFIENEEINVY